MQIRSIVDDELDDYFVAISAGFGDTDPAADVADYRTVQDLDQAFAALVDGEFVGGASAYDFEMTVPGGAIVPLGGVSCVAVAPTHRRQGVLTGLMTRQLDDLAARGTALAALNASESRIYRRFGYGVATMAAGVEIDTRFSEYLTEPAPGRIRLIRRDEATKVFPTVYETWRREHVGSIARSEIWWGFMFADREGWKGGGKAFHVLHEDEHGRPDGYVSYQIQSHIEHGNFDGRVRVRELIGATADVEAALWRFCFEIDLTRYARADMRPVDDPIRWRLVEPRQLTIRTLTDVLWLRLIDTAAALSVRGYAATDGLVLEVPDAFRPANAGVYLLSAEAGATGASCERTTEAPDLTVGVADLAAAYLGGVPYSSLHAAGLVTEHTAGAVARADALFATDRAPYCATTF